MTTITDKLAEALRDAARSLETIGRLAGKPYYGRDEQGEPIPTYMGHNDEVRSYANNRAGVARAALADLASQQTDPSSGSSKQAPGLCSGSSEPSDARVEAGARALAAIWDGSWGEVPKDMKEGLLHEARAVLKAADAVSAVPDGFALVPEKATPLIREALRIGMRREVPNDELCDIRWRAAIAAAKDSEQKGGV